MTSNPTNDLVSRLHAEVFVQDRYPEPEDVERRLVKLLAEAAFEIERLTRERDGARDEAERMRRTRDEAIRRLRAALEKIVESTDYSMGSTIRNIAREALGEPKL